MTSSSLLNNVQKLVERIKKYVNKKYNYSPFAFHIDPHDSIEWLQHSLPLSNLLFESKETFGI